MQSYGRHSETHSGAVIPCGQRATPMVLFDALGFDRIVVTMRFTAPYENNGFGFFWTTM